MLNVGQERFRPHGDGGMWWLLNEVEVLSSVTSVTFSNIPGAFRALVMIAQSRTDRAAESDWLGWQANGDSGSNYDRLNLGVNTAGLSSGAARGDNRAIAFPTEGANSRANNYAPGVTIWPHYGKSGREKWAICFAGGLFGDVSADADLFWVNYVGRWRSTAAITSLTLLPNSGPNIVAGSWFMLYGVV